MPCLKNSKTCSKTLCFSAPVLAVIKRCFSSFRQLILRCVKSAVYTSTGRLSCPVLKKLYSFCLAKQILEKVESKKTELDSKIKITPEILSGLHSSKGILLSADKEISVKELLRALIFLHAPEANKIALNWLETFSDEKEERSKVPESDQR